MSLSEDPSGWEELEIEITLRMVATPLPGGFIADAGTLDESVQLRVRLSEISASLMTLLALNQSYLEDIPPEDLRSPRCVLARALMMASEEDWQSERHALRMQSYKASRAVRGRVCPIAEEVVSVWAMLAVAYRPE